MAKRGEDRRVARTRRLLKEALLELIEKRDYDAVTVDEIARRADVGRSTFYAHFESKEALLFSGFEHWLLALADGTEAGRAAGGPPATANPTSGFRFSLPLLRHASSGSRFVRALLLGSDARLRRRTLALLVQAARWELERREAIPTVPRAEPAARRAAAPLLDARAHAVAGAFLGVMTWWVTEAPDTPAEVVDAVFQQVVAKV